MNENEFGTMIGLYILIFSLVGLGAATSCYHKELDAKSGGGFYEKLDPHQVRDR